MAESDRGAGQARARQGLGIYFAVLIPLTGVLEYLVLRTGDPIGKHGGLIFLLMWSPALASLVARIALREGVADVSFRIGGGNGLRAAAIACFYPLAVGIAAYGTAWAAGLARFSPPPLASLGLYGSPAPARFGILLAMALTAGTAVSMISAAGEEIGWRGYMLTRLIDAGVPRPVLASGLIWGAWHLPLILSGQYASSERPALSAAIFLINIVAFAYLSAKLRLGSGSVWPPVVLHASWNAIIQTVFDASTTGAKSSFWVGESGVLVTAANLCFVLLLVRGSWRRASSIPHPAAAPAIALEEK
jgi:membrane protease YdiL (CAAX protease family)